MDPVIDFSELTNKLTSAFQWRYDNGSSGHFRLIGIVFTRPQSKLAKQDIVPQIPDWHCRSGDHIDFFFAGYTYPHPVMEGYQSVPMPGHDDWLYSPQLFDDFRRDIESRTKWKYSGASDLLLANARFDPVTNQAAIDFSSIVLCQLDSMLEDKAIGSIERFFESIFRFAEENKDDDPAWGFSDAQGFKVGTSALKKFALSLLPKDCAEAYKQAEHFAVRDVSQVQ